MSIKSFVINTAEKSITIEFFDGDTACLNYEYLRISSPASGPKQQSSLITNKKMVILTAIENVGKHGFRLVFDDQHNAIFSAEYIKLLIKEYKERWDRYLTELKALGHSREALINITEL